MWPPNSRYVNLVDYGIWGQLQECVYSESIHNLEEYKQRLANMWADEKQNVVEKAIEQW